MLSPEIKSGFKTLIVGCGELGSRHLQAIAQLPFIQEIIIVDPRPEALTLGEQRLKELVHNPLQAEFQWHRSLDSVKTNIDFCIVATQAKGRAALIKAIFNQFGVSKFLIEKVVAQSLTEYEDLLQFAQNHSLKVWVNCKTRVYPIHQYIKKRLRSEEPIVFSCVGGNHGLANNGVHVADLFVFYDESRNLQQTASVIEPTLHPSKRGKEIFDLSGTLVAQTPKGGRFILSYAGDHVASDHYSIVTKSYHCIIDQMLRWAFENDVEKGNSWLPLPFEGDLRVSEMTKDFAKDILQNGTCKLPTLEDCWPAHRFILESLQPHFNRLLRKSLDYCPVT